MRSEFSSITRLFHSAPPSTFAERCSGGSVPRAASVSAAVAMTAWNSSTADDR
jgi:hypothetical protein